MIFCLGLLDGPGQKFQYFFFNLKQKQLLQTILAKYALQSEFFLKNIPKKPAILKILL